MAMSSGFEFTAYYLFYSLIISYIITVKYNFISGIYNLLKVDFILFGEGNNS